MNIDTNTPFRIAVYIVIAGLFILALTYIIPLLGIIIAFGIVAVVLYLIYLFLKGRA